MLDYNYCKDIFLEKCMTLHNDEKVYQKCRDKPKSIHSKEVKQLLDLKISIGPAFKDEHIKLDLPSDNSSPTIL